MKRITAVLILLVRFGRRAECLEKYTMVYDFDFINPSVNLTWAPCFDNFTCSKLQAPLDYSNPSLGTASIAFMKLAGKNATSDSESLVLIPGGPGGSSIDLLLSYKDRVGQMFGDAYNFVGFDPRGVERSSPSLDCFRKNTTAHTAFNRAHYTGTTNTSSTSLGHQNLNDIWSKSKLRNSEPYELHDGQYE